MTQDLRLPSTAVASQSTMTEQARELATIHAMMSMAQQFPRNEQLAWSRMQDACSRLSLAEKAFYRYPRSGEMVNGPSVHLARELARCWGNISHGIKELDRNDVSGRSEMLARAWDIETNTVSDNAFIVPHKRDTKKGVKDIVELRDIYENNANAGARRLREAIFAVLPIWFREEASKLCLETLDRGADAGQAAEPLVVRKGNMLTRFAEDYRISEKQLEAKIGRPEGRWVARDLATLAVVYKSLKAGETTVDQEFEREQVHAKDIAATAPVEAEVVPEPVAAQDKPVDTYRKALLDKMAAQIYALYPGVAQAEVMLDVQTLVGRNDIDYPGALTTDELTALIKRLDTVLADTAPGHALDAMLAHLRDNPDQ